MAPPSTDHPPAAAGLQLRRGLTRLQSSGARALNRSTSRIVRPPLLRKDFSFRHSRRAEEPFAYSDLNKQPLIRLLKLDKRSLTDRRPLGYALTTVKLYEAPPFYALSYCWGSATRDKEIVCNGKLLNVTAHLKRGILELQAIPMLAGCWIWIDQISINQDDQVERSHQVSFMRDIYLRSIRTIVWLGPSDGPSEGGYGLSKRLFDLCQRREYSIAFATWELKFPKRKLHEELDVSLQLALPRLNSPPWVELYRMLSKPWFNRIWVIQEVALSREPPTLVYGGKARDFMPLLLAGRWIGGSKMLPSSETRVPKPLSSFCIQDLYLITNPGREWTFQALVLHTLDHEATDRRDHIFALLGIIKEAWGSSGRPSELVTDYNSPPWKVFERATMYMIQESRGLHSLLLVGSTEVVKDDLHPSWVPDYGAKPSLPCPTAIWLSGKISLELPWRASGYLRTAAQHNAEDGTLSLDGSEVDQILWTSADTVDERDESLLFRWLEGAAGAILWAFDSFHTSVDEHKVLSGFFDAFVAIICAVYEDGNYRIRLGDFLEHIDAQEAAEQPREGYFRTMRTHIVGSILRETRLPAKPCQVSQVLEFFRTRFWHVFLTKHGSFGIARPSGQPGDIIAVLRGGAMPFILRPVGGRFKVVGPCVILKWMNGLAADLWEEEKIEQSRFTLI